jgi:hypothetical protein
MALTLLSTASVSASGTVEFTSFIDSAYLEYELHILNLVPTDSGTTLALRVSTDNGSTWKSGATDYEYCSVQNTYIASTGNTAMWIGDLQYVYHGSAAGYNGAYVITVFCPSNTATRTQFITERSCVNTGGAVNDEILAGSYKATTAVNGLQILVVNGSTMASGEFKLYGVAAS